MALLGLCVAHCVQLGGGLCERVAAEARSPALPRVTAPGSTCRLLLLNRIQPARVHVHWLCQDCRGGGVSLACAPATFGRHRSRRQGHAHVVRVWCDESHTRHVMVPISVFLSLGSARQQGRGCRHIHHARMRKSRRCRWDAQLHLAGVGMAAKRALEGFGHRKLPRGGHLLSRLAPPSHS